MLKIVIIGSGTVGTAIGRGLARRGHAVEFRDIDYARIRTFQIRAERALHLDDPFASDIDIFFICVPTPNRRGVPDLAPLTRALTAIAAAIQTQEHFSVVAVRSTVPVGTTQDFITPFLERSTGKKAGVDFGVCSNPEYLRAATALDDFERPRLVLIGSEEPRSARLLSDVYAPFDVPIHLVSTKEAEMHKYVHNVYNACKISFFNEQRMICERMSIDAESIFPLVTKSAEGCWNPLYGTRNAGPYAGECLPKDIRGFMGWARKRLGIAMPLLAGVMAVNEQMASARKRVVQPIARKRNWFRAPQVSR